MFPNYLNHPHDGSLMAHVREFDTHRGYIIAIWAGLETSLDRANHYGWLYTDKKIDAQVPVSLGRKMALFKKVQKLEPFAPIRELGMEIHEDMSDLFEDRHWLAHGALLPGDCTPEGWRLLKHEFPKKKDGGKGGLITHWRFFTHAEMFDLGSRSRNLANKAGRYCHALLDQTIKHPVDYEEG